MENESLQSICEQIKELADKAAMLAGALEEKDESARKYAEKCHVLAKRLGTIRDLLVEEYGENAKYVRTTTLIKRLIEEKNSCQKELSSIAEKVKTTNEINGESRDANMSIILANILNQSTNSQLADLARLRTVNGQGEVIRRQKQQIDSLTQENAGLRGQVVVLQAEIARHGVKVEQREDYCRTSENAQFQAQIHELNEQNERLKNEVEFVTLREQLSREAHGYEVEDLNKRIQDLESQLKNNGRFKISVAFKKFLVKIKSLFRSNNANGDNGERS